MGDLIFDARRMVEDLQMPPQRTAAERIMISTRNEDPMERRHAVTRVVESSGMYDDLELAPTGA